MSRRLPASRRWSAYSHKQSIKAYLYSLPAKIKFAQKIPDRTRDSVWRLLVRDRAYLREKRQGVYLAPTFNNFVFLYTVDRYANNVDQFPSRSDTPKLSGMRASAVPTHNNFIISRQR